MTTESLDAPAARVAGPVTDARAPRLAIALIALGAIALELAVSARYGYVRDELYFLAAGQHLAFGYVDQPPLTPLLARVGAVLGGDTVTGLRVLPALSLAALIMLTAAISRRLLVCVISRIAGSRPLPAPRPRTFAGNKDVG